MKTVATVAVTFAVLLAAPADAWASWQSHQSSAGTSSAATLPIVSPSSIVITGRMATIRWKAPAFGNGTGTPNWFLWHFTSNANGTSHYGGVCPPVLGSDGYYTCIDSNLPPRSSVGLWLQSYLNSWLGGFPPSQNLIYNNVGDGPTMYPTPSSYNPGQNITGSFFGFAPGQSLIFSVGGSVISNAAPTVVPANGTGTFTIPVPTSAAPGTYTITARDGAGNTGSFAFTINGPKSLTFAMPLTHPGGTLVGRASGFRPGETLVLRGTSPIASASNPSPPLAGPVTVGMDGTAQLSFVSSCTLADCSQLIWAVASPSGDAAVAPVSVDAAPPALTKPPELLDTNHDGYLDQVRLTYTKVITNTGPWSLSNTPAYYPYSVSGPAAVTGNIVTVPVTAATGAPPTTDVPSGLAINGSVSDFAGNNVSGGGTLTDKASPVPVQVNDMLNGDGFMAPGDYFDIRFSEAIVPGSSVATSVTESGLMSGNNTIDIPGVTNGPIDMGSSTYMRPGTTATFAATLSQPSPNVIRVTLGSPPAGCTNCKQTGSGSTGYVNVAPASTITDTSGNAAVANSTGPLPMKFF